MSGPADDDPAAPTHKLGPGESAAPPGGAWSLVIVRDGEVTQHVLPAQGPVSLGRGDEATVRVPDRSVSRLHAMVHVMGDKLLLDDLGSANGTRLRGATVEQGTPVPIGRGDVFELGAVTILLERAGGRGAQLDRHAELDHLVERVARGAISVLLLGETGVGKEVFAERIHALSPRAKHPMLRLNCAALTEPLLESELFGHEQGAFTGATAQKLGLLETAHNGTVFLDEVAELPPTIQAKLLRVIEDRKVMRVGGLEPRVVDMRFISATHRDLEAEATSGRFRHDLYYRLAAISLVIPPLRRRVSEIASLARELLADVCARDRRDTQPVLAPAALASLERHAWPGNVRELRNVLQRAVTLCDGDTIGPQHLPFAPPPSGATDPEPRLRDAVDSFELQRIRDAMAQCGDNQVKAAKLLGISRRTLVDRLSKAGLTRKRT